MSENQRDVKDMVASLLDKGPSTLMAVPFDLRERIITLVQTERDSADALQKRLDDGKCLVEKAAEVLGELAELRTRAEQAEAALAAIKPVIHEKPMRVAMKELLASLSAMTTRAQQAEAQINNWKACAECYKTERGEALDRAEKAEHDLAEAVLQRNNLLCRIHRDGGHYIAAHGVVKACEDADLIVAQLNCEHDALAEGT
jgi:chromosome segregation ATPase